MIPRALAIAVAVLAALLSVVPRESRLDAIAAQAFPAQRPGAAVIVMKGGRVLLRAGYGMADLDRGTRIRPDSVFRIGSMTKQFTAIAILQLVASGRIALDDPVTKFLPDYPTHGQTITVEHLLTHTSGIRNYTGKRDFWALIRRDMTPAQLIALFRDDPMQFEPGRKWAYSNSNYILLGAILEKVSGMPYAEYLRKNVFARAGLAHTYYGDVSARVTGYEGRRGALVRAGEINLAVPYAAGSLLSTVDDLAKWNAAVAAGKLVDRRLVDRAWTPYNLANGESTGYGYGWLIGKLGGERVIHHGGKINGFTSYGLWLPDHDVYVAVLSNQQSPEPAPGYVAQLLALEAIGKPWTPPKAIVVTPRELSRYTGAYRVDAGPQWLVSLDGDTLYLHAGNERHALIPVARSEFLVSGTFMRATFAGDAMVLDDGARKTRLARMGSR